MTNYNLNNFFGWPVTTRYLIVGLLCAIVFYLGYLWDISAMKAEISNNQSKENDLKRQLEVILNKEVQLSKETAQLPKLQENLVEWQKKLINYADLPELLNEILKIGGNNQLRFILFNPIAEKKVDMYVKVPIKIIAVGGYHQLANFVSQIANMLWIVEIGNFTIEKENKSDSLGSKLSNVANTDNVLIAEFTFEVYYLNRVALGGISAH